MAGPLHHHLHVLLPGPFGQLAQADQFLDLTYIGGVSQAAGAAGVAREMVTSYSRQISRISS